MENITRAERMANKEASSPVKDVGVRLQWLLVGMRDRHIPGSQFVRCF